MTPHPGTIADVCHRLRVATHTARVYIDELGESETTPEVAADIRADLRGYLMTVMAGLDALCPIHAVHDEPSANVVEMAVWPRPAPVRAVMPSVYAEKPEVWR